MCVGCILSSNSSWQVPNKWWEWQNVTPLDICECQHYLTDKHVLGKQFPLSKKVALKNSMPGGSDNVTPLNIGEWQHWSLGLAAATTLWPPSKGFVTRCRGVYCIFLVKRTIHIRVHTPALKRFCSTLQRCTMYISSLSGLYICAHTPALKRFCNTLWTHDKYFKI